MDFEDKGEWCINSMQMIIPEYLQDQEKTMDMHLYTPKKSVDMR